MLNYLNKDFRNLVIVPGGTGTITISVAGGKNSSGTYRVSPPVYRISSNQDIVVYAFINSQTSAAASLIIPVSALGSSYWVSSHVAPDFKGSMFGVVAVHDKTVFQIFDHTADVKPISLKNITLNEGDFYQEVQSVVDFTGLQIVSNKPVAAFSGTQCTATTGGNGTCDMLYEMLIPITTSTTTFPSFPSNATATTTTTTPTRASSYVACPTLARPINCTATRLSGGEPCVRDIFQIIATEDNTDITIANNKRLVLNKGQSHEYQSKIPHMIAANRPISVHQILINGLPNANTGDPELIVLASLSHFITNTTFLTPPSEEWDHDFITVAYEQGSLFNNNNNNNNLNGNFNCPTELEAGTVFGTTYCCTTIPIEKEGAQTLVGTKSFGSIVYGFSEFRSYGYNGGLALDEKTPTVPSTTNAGREFIVAALPNVSFVCFLLQSLYCTRTYIYYLSIVFVGTREGTYDLS